MFICEKCHTGPRQGFCGGRGSYGPCEGCGISRVCSDCHCDNPFNRKSPPKALTSKPVPKMSAAETLLTEKVAKLTLERRKLRKQVRTLKEQWARRNLR